MQFKLAIYILLSISIFSSFQSFAQVRFSVKGSVVDTVKIPLNNIAIQIVSNVDTQRVYTDQNGKFQFEGKEQFTIIINNLFLKEFRKLYKLQAIGKDEILPPIILKNVSFNLKEVKVRSSKEVRFKRDTIEYDATLYKSNNKDRLKQLVEQLPGLKLDQDGNLSFRGQTIFKLRVNGKDFFSGNVSEFLSRLPANIVEKVQIIDDFGDLSSFTESVNGKSEKIININTKPGITAGIFGDISSYTGSNRRYGISGNENLWQDLQQLSLNLNFNKADNQQDINTTNNAKLTYRTTKNNKLTVNGSFDFSKNVNKSTSNIYSQALNTAGNIYTASVVNNLISNKGYKGNIDLTFRPNTNNYFTLSPYIEIKKSQRGSFNKSTQSGAIIRNLVSSVVDNENAPEFGIATTFAHKFFKVGRLFNLTLKVGRQKSSSYQTIIDSISDVILERNKDSVFNRKINILNQIGTLSGNFNYNEPLSNKASLNVDYEVNISKQNNGLFTYVNDAYSSNRFVDSLSNLIDAKFSIQQIKFKYQYQTGPIRLIIGLDNRSNSVNSVVKRYNINKNYFSISPVLDFTMQFGGWGDFGVKYFTNNILPSIDQLSPVIDTRNIQNVIIGNPNLRPALNHNIDIRFNRFYDKSRSTLFLNLNFQYVQNQIVTNSVLRSDNLNAIKQETSFLNASGTYSMSGDYMYVIPVYKNALTIDLSGGLGVGEVLSFTSFQKNRNKKININQNVRASYRSEILSIKANLNFFLSKDSYIATNSIFLIKSLDAYVSSYVKPFKRIAFNIDINKKLNSGYINSVNTNPLIINFSAEKQLFKSGDGLLRLQLNDFLNQGNKLQHSVNNSFISDIRTKSVTRIWLLTFAYRIENFGSGK